MAKIFVSFNIVSTSNCFLVAREKDSPLAEVYRSDLLTTPHTQRNITIEPVNPVMHQVELWSTSDNINLDQLLGTCDIDASISTTQAFNIIQFVVDRNNGAPEYDPVSGQGQYVNLDLDGIDYTVFKENFGALKWGIDIQKITGGGFEFITTPDYSPIFGSGEGYTILISNLITSSTPSTGKNFPDGIIEVISDINLSSTHYNKLLEMNSTAKVVTVTITDINAIPEGTIFGINTHNGTQNYCTLKLPSGKYCLINRNQENEVYIGQAEGVTFIKKGSYLRLVGPPPEAFTRVGQRISADGLQPANTLPETGGWYLKSDYPRPVKWYIERLPIGEYFNGTDDVTPSDSDRTKWGIGDFKFWMPDRGGYIDRAIDPDANIDESVRTSGNIQEDAVGPADVNTTAWTGSGIGHNSLTVDSVGFLATQGDGGLVSSTSASGVNRTSARTITFSIDSPAGETRPKNVSTNMYRII